MNTNTNPQAARDAAREFINARPGFNPCNYMGDRKAYNRDAYRARTDRKRALNLLGACELHGVDISNAGPFSRLEYDGKAWNYVTGQYYPTEYRGAMVAHLERCLAADGLSDEAIQRWKRRGAWYRKF